MSLNVQNFFSLMKEMYADNEDVVRETYQDNVLMGVLPKVTTFGGTDLKVPFIYGDPQSIGPIVNAIANMGSTQTSSAAFYTGRAKKYSVVLIDGEAMAASEGEAAAFLTAKKTEIDSAFNGLSRSLAVDLYRDGTGNIGTISSVTTGGIGVTTATIQLTQTGDARNFEAGMWVNVVDVVNSQGPISLTSSTTVTGAVPIKGQLVTVNVPLNQLVLSLTAGTGTSPALGSTGLYTGATSWASGFQNGATDTVNAAATDTLCQDGCYNGTPSTQPTASSSYVGACFTGIAGYIPLAAPTSTLFWGVNRSIGNTNRLGGIRGTYVPGEPIEEAVLDLLSAVSAEGGRPDLVTMSFENYATLVKALNAKQTYPFERTMRKATKPKESREDATEYAEFGYGGIRIIGPKGVEVDVLVDNACPWNVMYALTSSTWELRSIGDIPRFLDLDNLELLRDPNSDAYQARIGAYGNCVTRAPGHNGVMQLH